MTPLRQAALAILALTITLAALPPWLWAADWPQWGGTNARNMVSHEQRLPADFDPDPRHARQGTARHVRWVAPMGTYTYGNPTVADGRLFVGTTAKRLLDDDRFRSAKGGLLECLEVATGKVLWQLRTPERRGLGPDVLFGHQHLGICSSPTVDGDRVYVVSSTAEILCLDVHGLADGNQGPFTDEIRIMVEAGKPPVDLRPNDADVLWRYDPIAALGVRPHDAASCSALIVGDFVYVGTSNGIDKRHRKILAPHAPSLIVLDKRTGRLAAVDGEEIGTRMFHTQWASPSSGQVNGRTLVFFGGGDGICYAFEALDAGAKASTEPLRLKKVWSYDCNPPDYRFPGGKAVDYYLGDRRKSKSPNKNDGTYLGPSQIIATPVFHQGRVYVAIGQDPAHGRGRGLLHCIDATQEGDISGTGAVWTYRGIDRSISTVAVAGGRVYAADIAGRLHCLDADTGKPLWVYETHAEMWGSPFVADSKVYFGTKTHFFIMAAASEAKLLSKVRMSSAVYGTPIAADSVLYIPSDHWLYAVSDTAPQVPNGP